MNSLLSCGFNDGVFGDLNADGVIDCRDNCLTRGIWNNTLADSPAYNIAADFNLDGVLDASDRAAFYALNPCRTDIDQNGITDTSDIFAFLSVYYSGVPAADFDGNGVVNPSDLISGFLSAWFAAYKCN